MLLPAVRLKMEVHCIQEISQVINWPTIVEPHHPSRYHALSASVTSTTRRVRGVLVRRSMLLLNARVKRTDDDTTEDIDLPFIKRVLWAPKAAIPHSF